MRGLQAISESGVGAGISQGDPAVAAAADLPALSGARPASPGLASSSAKSRSERRRSAGKVVGFSAGAGLARCAQGTWIPAPLCLALSGQCSGRADALEREIELQPPQRR